LKLAVFPSLVGPVKSWSGLLVARRRRDRMNGGMSAIGTKRRSKRRCPMSASLIGRLGSSAFRLSTSAVSTSLAGSRFSSESAPRPFHHGIRERGRTIYWAALPSDERQVQRTLRTHLIHRPARDIMPPRGGTRVSPIRFDYVQLSRCNSVLAPAELGAIDPDAVHDDGQATRQRDDCLFHAAAPGNLHRPGLEPGPFR
jgi:hypothetical protein